MLLNEYMNICLHQRLIKIRYMAETHQSTTIHVKALVHFIIIRSGLIWIFQNFYRVQNMDDLLVN